MVDFPTFKNIYHQIEGKSVPGKELERIDFLKVIDEIKQLAETKEISARESQLLLKYALKLMGMRQRKHAVTFEDMYEQVNMGEERQDEIIKVLKKEERTDQYSEIESIEVLLDQVEHSEPMKQEEDSELIKWRN